MKIPERIKKEIFECANLYSRANDYEKSIYEWLEKKNLTEDTANDITRIMDSVFIDSCKIGYDPEGFIEKIEKLGE